MMEPYIFIFIGIVILLSLPFVFPRFNRHKHKIKKADEVLVKIRNFKGEGVEARIFGYLRKIDPYVFEELLLTVFEEKGYGIVRNKRYSGDGGIDGKLIDNQGRTIYVQAKRYKNYISKAHFIDFYGKVVEDDDCYRGFFIHTGRTSKVLLRDNEFVEVFSGSKLIGLLK